MLFSIISLYHEAYVMRTLWHTMKKWHIQGLMHDRNAKRKIGQQKHESNLWKHTHFKASIKDFLIGISLPNLINIWNHMLFSIATQKCSSTKCSSYKNYEIKVQSVLHYIFYFSFYRYSWSCQPQLSNNIRQLKLLGWSIFIFAIFCYICWTF